MQVHPSIHKRVLSFIIDKKLWACSDSLQQIESMLETSPSLTVKDQKNDRQSLLPLEQIEAISAFGHM
ncbi:hypothetical protein [Bacillus zhangzhouensis]|uniref:hypothetical protein n=1 Tax=Bacillus zhangzhouensis TaxID=1178540 RepID=UPI000A9BD340|nr:hypothetical protein [Bacillus zhangzhouensis]